METRQVSLSADQRSLTIGGRCYPALWLRDMSRAVRDQGNGQRRYDLMDAPPDLAIASFRTSAQGVEVLFTDEGPHGQVPWADFEGADFEGADFEDSVPAAPQLFGQGDLAVLPTIGFDAFCAGRAQTRDWLRGFCAYGFGRFTNGPVRDGALFDLIAQFGYVRETNYGRHFEVRSEPNPTNLAYTGLGLPPHTDNPYREPVPTLQLLYCLENSATGGESQVVDGFAAALALREEAPAAFELLTRVPVPFAYAGQAGVKLRAARPLIQIDGQGQLLGVCYNTRSMQGVSPRYDLAAFYQAYYRFGRLLCDGAFEVGFRLEAGEAFLLDNRRVLHARAGFQADGHRWLQGAYADRDSLESRLAVLEARL